MCLLSHGVCPLYHYLKFVDGNGEGIGVIFALIMGGYGSVLEGVELGRGGGGGWGGGGRATSFWA